jgi:hypothetical protein
MWEAKIAGKGIVIQDSPSKKKDLISTKKSCV